MAVHAPQLPRSLFILASSLLIAACGDAPPAREGGRAPGGTSEVGGRSVASTARGERPFAALVLETSCPVPFNYLSGVRELGDGWLLAADPLGKALLRVNVATGVTETLGGVGDGPQEYRQPDQVFPLPGDSTLLVDLGRGRLVTVDPQGRLGEGLHLVRPAGSGFPGLLLPRFVDGMGRIYYQAERSRGGGPADSVAVAVFLRDTGATDTVAILWAPQTQVRSRRGGGFLPRMLEARDDWAVGPDGRVAVVRANNFSVEWHHPDGRVVRGPATPFEPDPVRAADKEAALEEAIAGGMSMTAVSSPAGVANVQVRRGGPPGGAGGPSVEDFEWARTLPPFRPGGSLVSPEGELWLERMLPAPRPPRMDVFDGSGRRVGYVELPPRSRLIGFGATAAGARAAYLVRTDEVGLKWLGRYRVVRE